jgi:hypothetical protein
VVRRCGDRHAAIGPLAAAARVDEGAIDRAAVTLALADELEARAPRGPIKVTCRVERTVLVEVSTLASWRANELDRRFERSFGKRLIVKPGRP